MINLDVRWIIKHYVSEKNRRVRVLLDLNTFLYLNTVLNTYCKIQKNK